jgi:hypothetical protein
MKGDMRKIYLFVIMAVSILIASSYASAVKPDSPPGLSKEKNANAPGQLKKTMVFETQKHFVNFIHDRILTRLAAKSVFPPGLVRLVNEFMLAFGIMESSENEEKSKVEISGEVIPSEDVNETIRQLVDSLNGTEGKQELKLKVKKQNDTLSIERNETYGELTIEQQDLWNYLVELVEGLVGEAEGDDVELEIEIEHELEIEEEIEEPEIEG